MKKILIRSLIVLVVLIIVAVIAVGYFLGDIVKKGVETYGPGIAKVPVKVEKVNVSLLGAAGGITGLEIGNPEGYKAANAITVGKASAAISPGSLLSDKIIIKSISVDSPVINFEGGLSGNNLTKILDNVNQSTSGATTNEAAAKAESGKKLQVNDFQLKNVKVNVTLTDLNRSFPLVIPDIHLTSLGTGPEGITAADLSKRVLNDVVNVVVKEVASQAANIGKEALGTATGIATNAVGEGIDKAKKSLGDLFKKKEK